MQSQKGIRRTVWLSNDLDAKADKVRKELGLGRSGFYRFAIVEVIKQFAVSEKQKNGENQNDGNMEKDRRDDR
jgi:hypothetical protein